MEALKTEESNKVKKIGGRPTHEGWELYQFEKVLGKNGKSEAKCLKCFNRLKNSTIARLLAHRRKCGSIDLSTTQPLIQQQTIIQPSYQQQIQQQPQTVTITKLHSSDLIQHRQQPQEISKIEIEDYDDVQRQDILWTQSQNTEAYEDENVASETMVVINDDIQRHRSSLSKRKSENPSIDGALSSFLIGCNLTFDIIDTKHFRNFVAALNPDYKIPSSKHLTSRVLNQLKGMDGQSGSEQSKSGKKRKYYSSDSDYE